MKYFTSDLHFHHPFVAALRGYAKEGFKSDATIREQAESAGVPLDEAVDWESHDKAVCMNIGAALGKGDDLYVLGDVSSGSRGSFDAAMETLKGLHIDRTHMHLVLGNHEDLRMRQGQMKALLDVFADVSVRSVVTIHEHNLAMSHFQFSTTSTSRPCRGCRRTCRQGSTGPMPSLTTGRPFSCTVTPMPRRCSSSAIRVS